MQINVDSSIFNLPGEAYWNAAVKAVKNNPLKKAAFLAGTLVLGYHITAPTNFIKKPTLSPIATVIIAVIKSVLHTCAAARKTLIDWEIIVLPVDRRPSSRIITPAITALNQLRSLV
ncbi:MAG: hypothetical protein S4CHLAM7_09570 [Chlamydiae bacterium]|nr:hypothetical protein [Chlamydiota bacterium]